MFSEKLLILLQSLSKYQLNQLRKFLCSPYFNEQEELVKLFELCNQAMRKGQDAVEKLDKTSVWQRLFPTQPFDDAQLRRMASELTQLTLRFLQLEYRENNPVESWLDWQKMLERPELSKHLSSAERQFQRYWEEHPGKSNHFYLTHFQYHWNIFSRSSKTVATADYLEKLWPVDHYLDCHYLTQKLKLYVAWLIFRGFRATPRTLPLMSGFWEYLGDERFRGEPLIHIYQKVILCLTEPDEEQHFKDLLAHLDQYAAQLAREDLRECYHIAQNYCAFKINQGRMEYYREVFEIFRKIIDQQILLEDGQLAEGVYKNIITASLGVGEFAWAEEFIQTYSGYLPASIRENARTFNLSYLYFHQKKYEKVIELLRNVGYSDVVYALGAKLMLLRTYYESGEYLAMDSLIDSFRIFLRRNKVISKELKREYNNFINFVKKLSTLNSSNPAAIEAFRQRVVNTPSVTTKKWLLEKIEELKG